jgi:hypothetical protein
MRPWTTALLRVVAAVAGVSAAAALALFIDRLHHPGAVDVLAALADLGLVAAFGALHSLTAAGTVKRRLERLDPALPRATHLVGSAAMVAALILLWQPVGWTIWELTGHAAGLVEAGYWVLLALGAAAILQLDALAFFGLRGERPAEGFRTSGPTGSCGTRSTQRSSWPSPARR